MTILTKSIISKLGFKPNDDTCNTWSILADNNTRIIVDFNVKNIFVNSKLGKQYTKNYNTQEKIYGFDLETISTVFFRYSNNILTKRVYYGNIVFNTVKGAYLMLSQKSIELDENVSYGYELLFTKERYISLSLKETSFNWESTYNVCNYFHEFIHQLKQEEDVRKSNSN